MATGTVVNGMTEHGSIEELDRIFKDCGLPFEQETLNRFLTYYTFIMEMNQEYDLTGVSGFENIVLKHFVDAVIIGKLIALPSPLLDIGTGGGFPGVPLKIAHPEIEIVLAEKRGKTVCFLRELCRALELEGVEIYPHRVGRKFARKVHGVITRALETISATLRRAYYFLPQGGRAIFMKGPSVDREIAEAVRTFGKSYEMEEDLSYEIPLLKHKRRLVVFRRR